MCVCVRRGGGGGGRGELVKPILLQKEKKMDREKEKENIFQHIYPSNHL